MINVIHAIFYKNINTYKNNKLDFFSMILRIFIFLFIFTMFSKSYGNDQDKQFLLLSAIIVNFILNTVIGSNFEIVNDLNGSIFTVITNAPINLYQYLFSQVLFQCILMLSVSVLAVFIFIGFNSINILMLFLILLFTFLIVSSISILLAIVTIKLKTFRYSSMIITMFLIISGMYYNVSLFPYPINIISYISPFTYIIDLTRSMILSTPYIMEPKLQLLILLAFSCFLFIITYVLIIKFQKQMLNE